MSIRSLDCGLQIAAAVIQDAADRERIQKLEAELAALHAKYPSEAQVTPKKWGRKPKGAGTQAEALL